MAAEEKGVEAEREPNLLLARFERRFLPWSAGKLPRWILPDDLTALGVLAALGVCGAYQLSNQAFGRFRLGYGLLGPTEIRVVLILLNTALALGIGLDFRLLELNLTIYDVIGLGIVAVMLALLSVRVFGNLRELAKEEPSAPRR
jgi:hypothetical protein